MDFGKVLNFLGNTFVGGTAKLVNTIGGEAENLYDVGKAGVQQLTGNSQGANQTLQNIQKSNYHMGNNGGLFNAGTFFGNNAQDVNNPTKFAANVAGAGLEVGSELAPMELGFLGATSTAGRIAAGTTIGAASSAAHTTGSELAGGNLNPGDVAQSAGLGALTGGFFAGAPAAAPYVSKGVRTVGKALASGSEAGFVGNNPNELLNPNELSKLAKSEDVKSISNQLQEKLGPVLADKVAPAVAKTNDPNVVDNIISNALNEHLPNAAAIPPRQVITRSPTESPELADMVKEGKLNNQTEMVPIQSLKLGSDTAGSFDKDQIKNYVNDIKNENTLDPLVVSEKDGQYFVQDGKHRLIAMKQTGIQDVPIVRQIPKELQDKGPMKPLSGAALQSTLSAKPIETTPLSELGGARPEDKLQTAFENALNQGDMQGAQATLDKIKSPDLKTSLQSILTRTQNIPESDVSKFSEAFSVAPNEARATLSAPREAPEPKPFLNAPEEAPKPTHLATAGGASGMRDILNSGGTVDEALNHYMESTGGSFTEAQKTMDKLLGEKGAVERGQVNAKLNPLHESAKDLVPKVQEGDSQQAILNARTVHNQTMRYGNAALAEVDKLSPHDLNLMDKLRGNNPEDIIKQAENPEQFRSAADAVKQYNDFTQATGSAFGQELPYRQNYGAPLKFDTSPENQAALETAKAKLKTMPGYAKGRTFKDYEEAAQLGVQRRFDNFAEDLADDVKNRSNDISQLALAKGLDEAYPGKLKVGEIGINPEGVYKQLLVPGGQRLSMPAEIANEINKRAPSPTAEGFWKGYDALNSNLKNIKLAGGGFHSLNVSGTYIAQQLASGKAFTNPSAISNMFRATFSPKFMDSELERLNQSGKLLDADSAGLKYGPGETQGDINPQGIAGNLPILKQIHQSIFDRQIPYMKLKTFEQLTEGLDRHNPEDMAKMVSIAKELNQNYGGINREIQGLTPQQFKLAARGFLATDYNEGQIRSLIDAFSKGGPEGKLARQVVFGKALLFGGLATVGGLAGGEFQGQKPQDVAIDILHKFVNPEFTIGGYKAALPTTQVAEVEKPIEQTVNSIAEGKGALTGLQNFATSRLAALPSEAIQLGTNKDFYGQPMYGQDTRGRPISLTDSLVNTLSGVAPIPAGQVAKAFKGQISATAAAANVAGLRVTPEFDPSTLPTAQQTYLQQLEAKGVPQKVIDADTQFFGLLKKAGVSRAGASDQVNRDIAQGDMEKAKQDAADYNRKLIQALAPWASNKDQVQYFTPAMLQQLRGSMIRITASGMRSRVKSIKSNPTKYGLTITGAKQ